MPLLYLRILNALTLFHVVLSLIGIGPGVVAIYGLLKAKTPGGHKLDGFPIPFHGVTPAQVLGILSLIALIIASLSIYRHHLEGI